MNALVTILDAALAANLGKRQWAVFAAVLRQTLGYRKIADDLSSGRLAGLTGIQRNHVWQAKQELVDKRLLVSTPGKFGEVLGFAVLQEKLISGFSADPVPTPVRATDSGFPVSPVPSATDSGYAIPPPATDSGETSPHLVTVSATATNSGYAMPPPATDSGLPTGATREVLHEKLPSPATASATYLPVRGGGLVAITPDLGVPASRFGPKTVPNQDTSLSNHTQSNHDNSTTPLPPPSGLPSVGGLGADGVPLCGVGVGLSATDSGLRRLSVSSCRSSATDSGCTPLPPLAGELEWPADLDAGMRQDMAGLLCGLAVQTAQSVLDVLAMGLEAGKVRKPLAYLRVLVRAAHNGELATAEAQAWREKRLRERTVRVSPEALERAGELAWVRQLAELQGLPVDLVATQLGVKMRRPHRTTVEEVGTAAASDMPAPQWKQDGHSGPPLACGGLRSVSAWTG
jgi:phage replication O-like protein O